ADFVAAPAAPAGSEPQIAALGPAELLHSLDERRRRLPELRIGIGGAGEDADTPYGSALLRADAERRGGRGADERDERTASHSITSSARASTEAGISSRSVLAVFRVITSSYLVGACTGRSAGFSPFTVP